jgi:peptidoglycan-associated lipoprotein
MMRKSFFILIFILCFGLILTGCPKKTLMKENPSLMKAEELAAEKERLAKIETEREAKETKERELAKIREEEAREEEAREEEARKEEAREEEARKFMEKEFKKSLVAKKEPGIEGEVFESYLLKDIHFDFDEYNIRPEDAEILKGNATLLMKYPDMKIQIEGHCDERGTVEYNLALGERRANNTKKYLRSLGLSQDHLSIISYGEERPLDPDHDEDAWAKNRRAHFIILSK